MKKIFILLLFSYNLLIAQTNTFSWLNNFGGVGDDNGYFVTKVPDGYLAIGIVENLSTKKDIIILKLDEDRNIIWQKTIGGSNDEVIPNTKCITLDNVGNIVLALESFSFDGDFVRPATPTSFVWFLKLDTSGNIISKNYYDDFPATSNQTAIAISQLASGGYAMLANFSTLTILDVNGNQISKKLFGSTYGTFRNIVEFEGGYIITGNAPKPGNASVTIILNVTNNGDIIWVNNPEFASSQTKSNSFKIFVNSDSTFDIIGEGGSVTYTPWVARYNNMGVMLWRKSQYNGTPGSVETINAVIKNSQGEYIMATSIGSAGLFNRFAFTRTSFSGDLIKKTFIYGDKKDDFVTNITQLADNSYLFIGSATSTKYLNSNLPLTNNNGKFDIVIGRINDLNLSTAEFSNISDVAIYPNPVVNEMFFKSKSNILKGTIYSADGKILNTYESKDLKKIDLRDLPAGTYLISIIDVKGSSKNIKFTKN